jgi:outer membrane protein assembly factor BamA
MSRWLLDHRGFLPVPIIVSDPTLGYGGGIALAFFHRPEGAAATRKTADGREQLVAPNIYGAAAVRTENDSEVYGGAASMHFADDRWRYVAALGDASLYLIYFTPGERQPSVAIDYNVDGLVSFQKVSRRLGDQSLFLGLQWIYTDIDIAFNVDSDRTLFTDRELAERTSGVGLALQYDQRDNTFTPSSGWNGAIQANFYGQGTGSDTSFQSYRANFYGYLPLAQQKLVLGGRVDLRAADGDVPFYRLPYVDLRGIGAARYQDARVATLETELRWNVTPRWAALAFVGAGETWGRRNDYDDADSHTSKGAGFRYLLARVLGLYAGVDYASGPEDDTVYIQVGSAWR